MREALCLERRLGPLEERLRLRAARRLRHGRGSLDQLSLLNGVVCELGGLFEVPERLVACRKRGRTLGRAGEPPPREVPDVGGI